MFSLVFLSAFLILAAQATPMSRTPERPDPLYHNDGFPRWVRQNSGLSKTEELPLLQNMQIAEPFRHTHARSSAYLQDYDGSMQELWPHSHYEMSSGPSLATRMKNEEEEDTAASSSMSITLPECQLNEESQLEQNDDDNDESYDGEEGEELEERLSEDGRIANDPTSKAMVAASKTRWNQRQNAWHMGLDIQHRFFMKAVVDKILDQKQAKSSKAFRRVYQSFTEAMIEELKNICDKKHGKSRHDAVEQFVNRFMLQAQFKKDSRGYKDSWTEGLEPDEIAELRQLLKESRRMRGTKFLNNQTVAGRRRILIPGTVENERFLNPRIHPFRPKCGDANDIEH